MTPITYLTKKEWGEFTKKALAGRPTLYVESVHIPMLIESFRDGDDLYQFFAKAAISKQTFYRWLEANEKLKAVYQILVCLAQGVLEKTGLHDKEINPTAWAMIMKNRFDYSDQRKLSIPRIKGAKTFDEQYKAIMEHAAEGNLSGQEANQLAALIQAGLKIAQAEEIKALREHIVRLSEKVGVPCEFSDITETA